MAKPNHPQPAKRAGLPPPRTPPPRPRARGGPSRAQSSSSQSVQSTQSTQPSPNLLEHRYEAQRRWFDHEVAALRRLVQTERFTGDFVAAQRLERELDSFIREVTALLEQERPR